MVIAGEGAVNIIQQKTAVAPIIEVRDRNNLPVAGATVTFSVGGSGASFGTGSTLTVVTNAAGQATAAGLTPTAAGAVQINVTAAMQGPDWRLRPSRRPTSRPHRPQPRPAAVRPVAAQRAAAAVHPAEARRARAQVPAAAFPRPPW